MRHRCHRVVLLEVRGMLLRTIEETEQARVAEARRSAPAAAGAAARGDIQRNLTILRYLGSSKANEMDVARDNAMRILLLNTYASRGVACDGASESCLPRKRRHHHP